jgi:peptide/nickel transport system permease protein
MAIETLPEASLPVTRPFRVKFGFLTSTPIIAVATICLVHHPDGDLRAAPCAS